MQTFLFRHLTTYVVAQPTCKNRTVMKRSDSSRCMPAIRVGSGQRRNASRAVMKWLAQGLHTTGLSVPVQHSFTSRCAHSQEGSGCGHQPLCWFRHTHCLKSQQSAVLTMTVSLTVCHWHSGSCCEEVLLALETDERFGLWLSHQLCCFNGELKNSFYAYRTVFRLRHKTNQPQNKKFFFFNVSEISNPLLCLSVCLPVCLSVC